MAEEVVINLETVLTAVFFLGMFAGILLYMLLAKFARFFKDSMREAMGERRD